MLICREAFFPSPRIDSGLAMFELRPRREQIHVAVEKDFNAFVSRAFESKRKTLANNLKSEYDPQWLQSCFKSIGLPMTVRAEALHVADFVQLFECLEGA